VYYRYRLPNQPIVYRTDKYDQTASHRAGNIGAGRPPHRTYRRPLGYKTAFESVADNRTWLIFMPICARGPSPAGFLPGHRAAQYLEYASIPKSAILDRSIMRMRTSLPRLHHLGNLNERDYLSYRRIFELVVGNLPAPDLLIYLRAPVPVLVERIQHAPGRSRPDTAEYLSC